MKITWFGGTTFRLYLGGKIFVTDGHLVPKDISRHEVEAAADHLIDLSDGVQDLAYLDPESWTRKKPVRLIDAPEEEIAALYTLSGEGLFIDEPAEGPVILAPGGETAWGHFADGAVAILFGTAQNVLAGAEALLIAARPRLIALAAEGLSTDGFRGLSVRAGGCAVLILEPRLAVEA